jgi:hypothetical protein
MNFRRYLPLLYTNSTLGWNGAIVVIHRSSNRGRKVAPKYERKGTRTEELAFNEKSLTT